MPRRTGCETCHTPRAELSEDGGLHHALFNSRVIDSLPAFLFPTRRRGTRWLREQLRELGVKAPLQPGCLDEFVASAAKEARLARASGETYAASLRRQLEARARFVHLWTTTDDKMEQPERSGGNPTKHQRCDVGE